ncbi:MAG: TorF family putative porin [Sphingobium sp.]
MNKLMYAVSALVLASAAVPAYAQDTGAPADLTVSGSASVVSDYRFRGVSQSDKHFAVQGGITVTHASGLYATVWGSSIDDYVAYGSDQEIDFVAGYSKSIGAATIDVGVLYYYYPGAGDFATDFFEPYASVSGQMGPVNAKVGVAYAPKQHAIAFANNRDDNTYVYGELSGGVPNTPISVTAHVGESFGRSVLSGGLKNYTDWSLNASYSWNNLSFGVTYVDTDVKRGDGTFLNGSRFEAKSGVFGTVAVSF